MFDDFWLQGQLSWNTPLLAGFMVACAFYGFLLLHFSKGNIRRKQPILFFLGLCLLYVTIGSPLATISHLSFSLHMIQMSMLYFIIPPLLLLGIPGSWLTKTRLNKLFLPRVRCTIHLCNPVPVVSFVSHFNLPIAAFECS